MLGITSGLELLWNRRDWTVRKSNGMWIGFNYLSTKIAWKFQFKYQLSIYSVNYPNINFHYCKIKNSHLNPSSSISWKIWKLRLTLNNSLKKRFMVETIYCGNLHHLPLGILKIFLAILDNFNRNFFFVRQP